VDEPRQAVEEAGRFVDDLVQQVADALRQQRGQLAGPEGATEELRLALRSYRQFVDRLLGLAAEPAPQPRGRGGVPARRPGDPRAAPVAGRVLLAVRPELGDRAQPELYRLHGRGQHLGLHHPGRGPRGPARVRRALVDAAGREGLAVAAAGTHPFSHWADQEVTDKAPLPQPGRRLPQIFREEVVFGCHVHVGFDDREAAIQTMNRVRPMAAGAAGAVG
jgi:hypothetical protein